MYLLGYDCGTSSIKATLLEAGTGKAVSSVTSGIDKMDIISEKPGWAEQNPENWWQQLIEATAMLLDESGVNAGDIKAIGIAYQMHGLVLVDKNHKPLRDCIIWCDSRAIETGQKAFQQIGPEKCLSRLLNSPGNFTASRLKWVKDNEPDIYKRVHKAMLPGDYIAMKMTGNINTTASGLSEMILWDFQQAAVADFVLDYFGLDADMLADTVDTFSIQGTLTPQSARQLKLAPDTPICYRAGDQPNNAFSLNVFEPGQIAATAGTSGVVYGVTDKAAHDPQSRVNSFVHVNHSPKMPRNGVLLCINGAGIANSWCKNNLAAQLSYEQINKKAATIPPGSDGLYMIPFGNGAERTLAGRDIGALWAGLDFNRHSTAHMLRACQESVAFAFNYGIEIMKDMQIDLTRIRAGKANMFLSDVFTGALAGVSGAEIELYNTDGSQGAARAAGVGAGIYKDLPEAFEQLRCLETVTCDDKQSQIYRSAYDQWAQILQNNLGA